MFQFFNNHPKRLLIDDCVKRAVSLAANIEYATAQRELNRHKRLTGATSYNTDHNPHSYVENVLHAEKLSFPARAGEKRMTGAHFCEVYPHGRYILDMPEHWTACIDGIIYDTWDPSDKIVYTAYKITPRFSERPPKKELIPKSFTYRTIRRDTEYLIVHRYIVTVCHENGVRKDIELDADILGGYKRCLRDFGYKEIKEPPNHGLAVYAF